MVGPRSWKWGRKFKLKCSKFHAEQWRFRAAFLKWPRVIAYNNDSISKHANNLFVDNRKTYLFWRFTKNQQINIFVFFVFPFWFAVCVEKRQYCKEKRDYFVGNYSQNQNMATKTILSVIFRREISGEWWCAWWRCGTRFVLRDAALGHGGHEARADNRLTSWVPKKHNVADNCLGKIHRDSNPSNGGCSGPQLWPLRTVKKPQKENSSIIELVQGF